MIKARFVPLFMGVLFCLIDGVGGAAACPTPRLQRVAPGVFRVAGSGGEPTAENCGRVANAGVLVGPGGAVVIDPGPSRRAGKALAQAVQRVTGRGVVAVINTHAHPEHVLGNSAWRVPVWASGVAADLMARRCEQCLKRLTGEIGQGEMAGTRIRLPTQRVTGPTRVVLAGRSLLLLPFAHAHTPGDLAILDDASGVLFAGDLAWGDAVPALREASLAGWKQAIGALLALRPGLVVPGHGAEAGGAVIADTAAYLNALEQAVQAELDAGGDLSQVTDRVVLPPWAGKAGYGREHRANVNRVFLELEAAAFER